MVRPAQKSRKVRKIQKKRLNRTKRQRGGAIAEEIAALPLDTVEINFHDKYIGDAGAITLADKLSRLTQLKTLILYTNRIGDTGMDALALALPAQLETLDLGSNIFEEIGANALASALPRLTQLKVLRLTGNNNIGSNGVAALMSALSGLANLETLELGILVMKETGASALAASLPSLTGLRVLDLDSNYIGSEGIQAIAKVLPVSLIVLHLSNNQCGNDAVVALGDSLANLTNLQKLNLSFNNISKGLPILRAIHHLVNLTELNLGNNELGYKEAKELAEFLPSLTKLKTLRLGNNKIGDNGIAAITGIGRTISGEGDLNAIVGPASLKTLMNPLNKIERLEIWDNDMSHEIEEFLNKKNDKRIIN